MIDTVCLCCSKTFRVKLSRARYGRGKYCSNDCQYASMRIPDTELLSYVDRREPDDCWEWTGKRNKLGYGWTSSIRGTSLSQLAHRRVYEILVEPIPSGLLCLHRCDNPPCCNPNHLFLGTHQDNN